MEIQNLQLFNVDELERVWRSSRRQRIKTQENLVWDKFCKEQDIVTNIYQDDPYQFLDEFTTDYHKEVQDRKLENIKESTEDKDTNQDHGESLQKVGGHLSVTFADDTDDDEQMNSDLDTKSHNGIEYQEPQGEEEHKSEEQSPCTVRENSEIGITRETEMFPVVTSFGSDAKNQEPSTKKPTNRTNLAESSICCAKVMELRSKINTTLEIIVVYLDVQDLMNTYPEDYVKIQKRANEFCARFSRVYLYQLQRQLHAIKRNNSVKLPFAKHTQFQSQMVRIVSLHQNILQSLQVYHKSFEQTLCAGDCAEQLQNLVQLLRDSSAECADVACPADIVAADLYNDSVLSTCERVETALSEHAAKAAHIKHAADSITLPRIRINCSKSKSSKHPLAQHIQVTRSNSKTGSHSKSGSNSACGAEPRLSMYSLDALKSNSQTKSRSDKDSRHSTKQVKRSNAVQSLVPRCGRLRNLSDVTKVGKQFNNRTQEAPPPPRSNRKSPKCARRPHLTRGSQGERAKNRRPRDTEIRTMVEGVEATASCVFNVTPQTSKDATPRILKSKVETPKESKQSSPTTTKPHMITPRTPKSRLTSPNAAKVKSPSAKLAKTANDSLNEVNDEEALKSSDQKAVGQAVNNVKTDQDTTENVTATSARRIMCSKVRFLYFLYKLTNA